MTTTTRWTTSRIVALLLVLGAALALIAAFLEPAPGWIHAGSIAATVALNLTAAALLTQRRGAGGPSRTGGSEPLPERRAATTTPTPVPATPRDGLISPSRPDDPRAERAAPRPGTRLSGDSDPSGIITSPDMVCRLDPYGLRWLKCTPPAQKYLGWSMDQLRNMAWPDIVVTADRDRAWRQLRAAVLQGEAHSLVYRIRTASGRKRAVELNVNVRHGPNRTPLYLRCVLTDVTPKVRARAALRRRTRDLAHANDALMLINRELHELKDRYRDLYQHAPAMYFSLDRVGTILVCNETMLNSLGYNLDQLVGTPYTSLLSESVRPQFMERHARVLTTGRLEVESGWIKADGARMDVLVTATRSEGDGSVHVRGAALDITTRKALEAELQRKNASLAQANQELSLKNRELDEFSYVVSHDLKEPLRTLISFSEFLAKDCGEGLSPEGREYLGYILSASRRLRALINDLLALSRAGRSLGVCGPVPLNEVLTLVREDLDGRIRARRAQLTIAPDLPSLWGDRDRLVQLFSNLLGNALKHSQNETPRVRVETRPGAKAGWATVAVVDNGPGIEPQYHDRIFQLFRTLQPRDDSGEGTGAGLAICQKIVHAHGGRIWVESQPGEGSSFLVKLPTHADVVPALASAHS